MNPDLDILIAHLQDEYDYLKSSMDECISEWDFDGAKVFRDALTYTRHKLNVLKNLENSNFNKISRLKAMISATEKSLDNKPNRMDNLDDDTMVQMEEYYASKARKIILQSKNELDALESIVPKLRIDDDKILELLECLKRNEIKELEFEIMEDQIFLRLSVNNNIGELEFRTPENVKFENFLVKSTKTTLMSLGYNMDIYRKQILNFNELDPIKILEELSVIYFEVFGVFGKELKIKIK